MITYDSTGWAKSVRTYSLERRQPEQLLASETESARQVQAQLVPADFLRLSGFWIEAAYLPAAEVGGDCLPGARAVRRFSPYHDPGCMRQGGSRL